MSIINKINVKIITKYIISMLCISNFLFISSCSEIEDFKYSRNSYKNDGNIITVIDSKNTNYKNLNTNDLFVIDSRISNPANFNPFSIDEINSSKRIMKKNKEIEIQVSASSSLKGDKKNTYNIKNIIDSIADNGWSEGKPDYGIGESIELILKNTSKKTLTYNSIILFNGYRKNYIIWNNNSRVKKLRMFIDKEPYAIINLIDTPLCQIIHLPNSIKLIPKKKVFVKFVISDIYNGDKYKDTCLSYINLLFGYS